MQANSSKVAEMVYVSDINRQNLAEEIRRGLRFVGFNEVVNRASTVFIKPNLTDSVHNKGITTTPLMIETIIDVISPLVKRAFVGESDGGNYSFSADTSLKNHNIYDVANHFSNVEVVNLSKLPRTRVHDSVCGRSVWVDLPDLLLNDIDCLISVPVFKTHAMTLGTFSIKNLWGCYPDPMRGLYHKNLDRKLALINKLVKNRFQIIDGLWSLDGHGPMEGTPIATNKVLVANNPVAADATAAYLMHLDATSIGHITMAAQYGLGTADLNQIQYNRSIEKERFDAFKPYKVRLDYLSTLLFNSEILSKLVLASPFTLLIYSLINMFRPNEKRTYCASHNRLQWEKKGE